jgi:hypothetical protein
MSTIIKAVVRQPNNRLQGTVVHETRGRFDLDNIVTTTPVVEEWTIKEDDTTLFRTRSGTVYIALGQITDLRERSGQ